MKKSLAKESLIVAFVSLGLLGSIVYSHCQIPCGIYGDPARFDMLDEHITTIEKSMRQITELSQEKNPNFNQLVRWINNKDEHADEMSHIITYYFLAQRITPVDKAESKAYADYIEKLTLLHEMLFYTMKSKQTTDLANIDKLRTLLADFKTAYFCANHNEH